VILVVAIVQVASLLLMIALVLMHSGKGGGLSDMFGGTSSAALGSTAAERNLNRITVVVALVFSFSTVALGLLMN
jgi:preprotein translocase subunit SecG